MSTKAPFTSQAPKLGMVTSMDGIRGIGVMMLIVGHALFAYVESWVTIIDSFFVLSGFLITTLLIQEHRSTGTIGLKAFYWRRGLRLFPSVWLFVGVWIVIGIAISSSRAAGVPIPDEIPGITDVLADGAAAVGYVYHLFFPNGLYVIDPEMQQQRTMWHLWTLGMEEWFYICIAGTVLVCIKKNWIKQLGIGLGITFVAIGLARWFAYTGFFQDDENMIAGVRMILLQRPDALMLGVLLAIINAYLPKETTDRHSRWLLWMGTAGIALWLLMLNTSSGAVEKLGGPYFEYLPAGPEEFNRPDMLETTYWFRFGHTLGAIGFALILFCLVRFSHWWLARAWSWQPFQWMGQRSYTIYIWHALPFLLIMGMTGGEDAPLRMQLLRLPFMAAVTIAISVVVYNKVEMRVLKSKLRFTADKYSKTAVLAAQADAKADMDKTKDEIRSAEPADFADDNDSTSSSAASVKGSGSSANGSGASINGSGSSTNGSDSTTEDFVDLRDETDHRDGTDRRDGTEAASSVDKPNS
ncbi:MAG: acyltransferase family protein [Microthrixaceae bacterium]